MINKLFFLLLLIFQISYSQDIKIKEKELFKIFRKTIIQDKKGIIQINSNPWFTDNSNDNYFKKDTIIFRNAKSYNRNYCKIFNWNFYKKNALIISDADYCNEPPSQKVTKPKDWIKLKTYNFKNCLILELYNQNKLVEKFKVLSVEENQSKYNKEQTDYILKLLRIKNYK